MFQPIFESAIWSPVVALPVIDTNAYECMIINDSLIIDCIAFAKQGAGGLGSVCLCLPISVRSLG